MSGAILWLEPKKLVLQTEAEANGDGEILRLESKYGSLAVQISGTFDGTVNFEATYDGQNYVSLVGVKSDGTGAPVTTVTGTGTYIFNVLGVNKFKARISDYASGEVTVVALAMPMPVALTTQQTGSTTPTHTVASVTTDTGAALAANANRNYALFVNDSDTIIYLKLGAAAVANQGIRLNANGGSYEMAAELGNLYQGAVNAIHGGTGTKVLLVTEGV